VSSEQAVILALDVGERHTGVAYARLREGIPLPLDTISHRTKEELLDAVAGIVGARNVSTVVLGHPLLPSGDAGKQAWFIEGIAELLRSDLPNVRVELLDERHTTPRNDEGDEHATAAIRILQTYLERAVRRNPKSEI
jgi:putative Holliday junction resolvase